MEIASMRIAAGPYSWKDLGWKEIDTSPEAIAHYIEVTGDDNPWYRGPSPFGGPVVPATFLHYRAYDHNPGWFPEDLYGTLFASVAEARVLCEGFRREYNEERPHTALQYQTPEQYLQNWQTKQEQTQVN